MIPKSGNRFSEKIMLKERIVRKAMPVFKAFAAMLALVALPVVASSQGVIAERNISTHLARAIADAAMECANNGAGLSVAVVDRSGGLRVLLRGDGSPPHGAELARRKAYTARTFRRSSLEWAKRSETALAGQRSLAEVIPLGGGVPIQIGDETIGAVGVSGTSGGQEGDDTCAKAAVAKVADQLK
jgi:uncharacterized protein GlcG (DUF336 family)